MDHKEIIKYLEKIRAKKATIHEFNEITTTLNWIEFAARQLDPFGEFDNI